MKLSPEIEATLTELTTICCEALQPGQSLDRQRVDSLAENLSVSGWERHSEDLPPLSTILKDRVREASRDTAMHRGAELDGVVSGVQSAYNEVSRGQASSASDDQSGAAMPPRTMG